jgi:hypothetical protein
MEVGEDDKDAAVFGWCEAVRESDESGEHLSALPVDNISQSRPNHCRLILQSFLGNPCLCIPVSDQMTAGTFVSFRMHEAWPLEVFQDKENRPRSKQFSLRM